MEISRRHLQPLEESELARALEKQEMREYVADQLRCDASEVRVVTAEDQERAAELQAQVDGLTRNQRRILNKRMAKAAKRK